MFDDLFRKWMAQGCDIRVVETGRLIVEFHKSESSIERQRAIAEHIVELHNRTLEEET